MRKGEIVELGDAEQITTAPKHEYTRTLLAATPEVKA
jgi:ABC-type dipeptide/oligopeptide/nickel transport system ATPase component